MSLVAEKLFRMNFVLQRNKGKREWNGWICQFFFSFFFSPYYEHYDSHLLFYLTIPNSQVQVMCTICVHVFQTITEHVLCTSHKHMRMSIRILKSIKNENEIKSNDEKADKNSRKTKGKKKVYNVCIWSSEPFKSTHDMCNV